MTRERPILFSGAMVRAILAGQKTQTRRMVKPQPRPTKRGWWEWGYALGKTQAASPRRSVWHAETWQREAGTAPLEDFCPYGQPGGRLWVRETWGKLDMGSACYRADDEAAVPADGRWRPSIHMPRWASRLTLEVTEVRVQRLQEISEEDALAEGIPPRTDDHVLAVPRFRTLWESINGERPGCSWESNPWVWCVSFRRVS